MIVEVLLGGPHLLCPGVLWAEPVITDSYITDARINTLGHLATDAASFPLAPARLLPARARPRVYGGVCAAGKGRGADKSFIEEFERLRMLSV